MARCTTLLAMPPDAAIVFCAIWTILNLLLNVSSCKVTLRGMSQTEAQVQIEEQLRDNYDDHLADFIKSLTPDDVCWLWLTTLQSKPHLAD